MSRRIRVAFVLLLALVGAAAIARRSSAMLVSPAVAILRVMGALPSGLQADATSVTAARMSHQRALPMTVSLRRLADLLSPSSPFTARLAVPKYSTARARPQP